MHRKDEALYGWPPPNGPDAETVLWFAFFSLKTTQLSFLRWPKAAKHIIKNTNNVGILGNRFVVPSRLNVVSSRPIIVPSRLIVVGVFDRVLGSFGWYEVTTKRNWAQTQNRNGKTLCRYITVAQSCQTHNQRHQQQLTWKEQQLFWKEQQLHWKEQH